MKAETYTTNLSRRKWIAIAGAWLCPALEGRAAVENTASLEYQVKAAYLFRMAEYVEWPDASLDSPDAPFNIAVIGADPFVAQLKETLAGRTLNKRPFTVRAVGASDNMADVQILFIGRDNATDLKKIAARLSSQPTLVVTEFPGALAEGGMINFVRLDNRIGFEIGLSAASRSGIKFSSRLLTVAVRVEGGLPR